jgi:hypothetical protein
MDTGTNPKWWFLPARPVMSALVVVVIWAYVLLALTLTAGHHLRLQYNPDGVQMTCPSSELGWTATIYGDGRPFTAVCAKDGPVINVWDATS